MPAPSPGFAGRWSRQGCLTGDMKALPCVSRKECWPCLCLLPCGGCPAGAACADRVATRCMVKHAVCWVTSTRREQAAGNLAAHPC